MKDYNKYSYKNEELFLIFLVATIFMFPFKGGIVYIILMWIYFFFACAKNNSELRDAMEKDRQRKGSSFTYDAGYFNNDKVNATGNATETTSTVNTTASTENDTVNAPVTEQKAMLHGIEVMMTVDEHIQNK